MKKCNCLSAPQYHREDCLVFDVWGNHKKKILFFHEIELMNPSKEKPIKLGSSMLKRILETELKDKPKEHLLNRFEYIHSEVQVIGVNPSQKELILIDRTGSDNYIFCSEARGSFYFDEVIK